MIHEYPYPDAADNDRLAQMLEWSVHRMRSTIEPGFERFRADATAIGHSIDGRLTGVVVYDTFMSHDCLIHLVSDGTKRWLTRDFIVRAMAYPFAQLQQRRVTALVSEHNAPSRVFTAHFGFREEGRMRAAGSRGEDVLVFGLLRSECRWLPENGFSIPARAGKAA